MAKVIPQKIRALINEQNALKIKKDDLEKELKATESEWHRTSEAIQNECNHNFVDGTSAWEHRYAYSFCTICNYDDL